jgi:hypothetical protein
MRKLVSQDAYVADLRKETFVKIMDALAVTQFCYEALHGVPGVLHTHAAENGA